jgi:hypothetical protein
MKKSRDMFGSAMVDGDHTDIRDEQMQDGTISKISHLEIITGKTPTHKSIGLDRGKGKYRPNSLQREDHQSIFLDKSRADLLQKSKQKE